MLTTEDYEDCEAICKFLKPFQQIGATLGSEVDVSLQNNTSFGFFEITFEI